MSAATVTTELDVYVLHWTDQYNYMSHVELHTDHDEAVRRLIEVMEHTYAGRQNAPSRESVVERLRECRVARYRDFADPRHETSYMYALYRRPLRVEVGATP